MNIRIFVLLCSLFVSAAACRHTEPAPEAEATPKQVARDYYPLQVGNAWTYEIRAQGETMKRTIAIEGEQQGFFVDNTGAALRHDATGLRDRNRYLLQNPIVHGRKWLSVQSPQSTEFFEITSVGSGCSTRAGSFSDCVTVKSTNEIRPGKSLVIESTYAKDVGLVSLQTVLVEGTAPPIPQIELELVSYKLAP